ncbi:MAG: lipopolysaccharide ABC transporter substrate-binding protein LptA, partial [Hafniaceae bacterium]|nr:lipopolysaccharide ABC transporter substrate-binding protein LptA [Hafniaceae bacterium]
QKLRYELDKDFVILTGDAFLKQVDSSIKGDKITYLVKQQQMEAFSDKGKRVTTVLIPSQLQDKSGKAAPAAAPAKSQPQSKPAAPQGKSPFSQSSQTKSN